ncbi:MAG TPA: hypothetical protein VIL37_19785 [Natronosporangium sp.]
MSRPEAEPEAAHCPWCGAEFDRRLALVQAFHSGPDRWYACWCQQCGTVSEVVWRTSVVVTERVGVPVESGNGAEPGGVS